jgi:4-hydroxy-tetrahydrodipicolinate synthase
MTALEAFLAEHPGRLRGIRDESPDGELAAAALDRFGGYPFEIYAGKSGLLPALAPRGAAGVIAGDANLLGRACATVLRDPRSDGGVTAAALIAGADLAMQGRPATVALKTLIARNTGQAGWLRVRLPLRPLADEAQIALFKAIDETGLRLPPVVALDIPALAPGGAA